jgi:hypothetical protein
MNDNEEAISAFSALTSGNEIQEPIDEDNEARNKETLNTLVKMAKNNASAKPIIPTIVRVATPHVL